MDGVRSISFASDYGYEDEFAGVCRGVIARIAPRARVLDLSHGIARHDVAGGAAMLERALPFVPAGIHLAVVDPGVGSDRRAVAIRVADAERILVGPDNGLLWLAIERLGGALEAIDVSRSPVRLEPLSATFHGRDLFAPVAAHLALGAAPAELGEPFDPAELVALERQAQAVRAGNELSAAVADLDSFGNVVLVAAAADAADAGLRIGTTVEVEVAAGTHEALYARTFAEREPGALLLYVDASNSLALAINRASAAELLGLAPGDEVRLRPS